jgi:SAM-dependent methyltransferase
MRLIEDVLALPACDGRWVLYNPRTVTALALDAAGLAALSDEAAAGPFRVWTIGRFTNTTGLLADPTGWLRDPGTWPEPLSLDRAGLDAKLVALKLAGDDPAAYRAYLAPKQGLLDRDHKGNFHQVLGQHILLELRQRPETWWVDQKFEPDRRALRPTLYRAIQETYLRRYFPGRFGPGQRVLDIGCGIGFYTGLIGSTGATVTGVDPNAAYIEMARTTHGSPTVTFETASVGTPDGLGTLPEAGFDFVFMSDALLFYFVGETPRQVADIDALLADIKRLLKPGGRFISVEPHYLFWLTPWLGAVDNPYTVLTGYLDAHHYRVTPPLSRFLQAFCRNGFAVTWMDEMTPDPAFAATDPRATAFASRFPLWQLYEFSCLA